MFVDDDEALTKVYCTICGEEQGEEYRDEEGNPQCHHCGTLNRNYSVKQMMDFTNIILRGRGA